MSRKEKLSSRIVENINAFQAFLQKTGINKIFITYNGG